MAHPSYSSYFTAIHLRLNTVYEITAAVKLVWTATMIFTVFIYGAVNSRSVMTMLKRQHWIWEKATEGFQN
jgi:hypothetical protein